MADIAALAVGFAVVLALRPSPLLGDPLIGILCFLIAIVLTAATDRAFFARRRRVFWRGFAATAWLCAGLSMTYFNEARRYLLQYGPPLVRERNVLRNQIMMVREAQMRGISVPPPPRVSEWHLLASALTETGIGLALGILVAALGGLGVVAVARFASRVGSTGERLGMPNPSLDRGPTPTAAPGSPE
jgi:hypothetical protein